MANTTRQRLSNTTLLGAALHMIVSFLAAIGLVFGAILVAFAGGWHASADEAEQLAHVVVAMLLAALALFVVASVACVFLLRRHAWARWCALGVQFLVLALALPLVRFPEVLFVFVLFAAGSVSAIACLLSANTRADFESGGRVAR